MKAKDLQKVLDTIRANKKNIKKRKTRLKLLNNVMRLVNEKHFKKKKVKINKIYLYKGHIKGRGGWYQTDTKTIHIENVKRLHDLYFIFLHELAALLEVSINKKHEKSKYNYHFNVHLHTFIFLQK